jgi:membrane protease YdiL (CAAX protease family)
VNTARTRAPSAAVVVVAIGTATLLARPALVRATDHPVGLLVGVFMAVLAVGATWPVATSAALGRSGTRLVIVTAAGATAFALGRLTGDWHGPSGLVGRLVVLNGLAAVAEEAFFRRFLYGMLERQGAFVAVVGSAALFALVHVTVYGAWVLPLDLAAGLVLSWQRWASGSWGPPAVTHVIANVLALS